MKNYYFSQIMGRVQDRLAHLYGSAAPRLLARLAMMIGRYEINVESRPPMPLADQRACLLITYADTVRAPQTPSLAVMSRFLAARAGKAVTHLHILPFCPSSSDDGFSVIHFRSVNPQFGQWSDLQTLSQSYDLVFDMVLNHVSSQSGWFQDYIAGIAPGRDYFIEADPAHDFSGVVRPRRSSLLTPIQTYAGVKNVWTTFSADQIDLNYTNPDVLFEMLDIMMFYIAMGARVLRLDAVAYLWKRPGTNCLNLPETHEIVRLLRDMLALNAPDIRLLTETNLPHAENLSYFGDGDQAHWIYQFSLPPLLLHALTRGTARYLAAWAGKLPPPPAGCAYLNITGTHDGIGIRPLEGLVPEPEIAGLVDHIVRCGGRISTRRAANGADAPYELNSTWFDALGGITGDTPESHLKRFLCAQTILMTLQGIPAVYFNTLLAASNDQALAGQTGMNRSLNRGKWQLTDLDALLANPASVASRSLAAHLRMLKIRAEHPAFHPDGAQIVAAVTDSVLGIERAAPDGTERILALANLSNQPARLARAGLQPHGWQNHGPTDLLTGQSIASQDNSIALEAYAVAWLLLSR
ncbi:MAG: alpha-amylase family glycosyl hydrolase [Verrucomicrobiota bacterium]